MTYVRIDEYFTKQILPFGRRMLSSMDKVYIVTRVHGTDENLYATLTDVQCGMEYGRMVRVNYTDGVTYDELKKLTNGKLFRIID